MVDAFLIAPYRWPDIPDVGWWLGTTLLAAWCTILGKITLILAYRVNHSHVKEIEREMVDRHNQSVNALKAGNKPAYKAINRLANEAYGKTFFFQVAMACSSLWPVPFALGWMQARFSGVDFLLPFTEETVSYPFVFIPLYIFTNRVSPSFLSVHLQTNILNTVVLINYIRA